MKTSLRMNKEFFIEQIERLQKGLNGNYTQEQISLLFSQVKKYKTKHLQSAVDHLLLMEVRLQAINKVVAGCRTEAYGEELEENKQDQRFAKDFLGGKKPNTNEMEREASQLVREAYLKNEPGTTKQELYHKMLAMDKKYPGVGWKENADIMIGKS